MKVSAKITVALCPILFWSTLAYEFTFTSSDTVSALHISGNSILDSNNNIVYLRGIGRTGDIQSASGMWSGPGDDVASWDQKWYNISDNFADGCNVPMLPTGLAC